MAVSTICQATTTMNSYSLMIRNPYEDPQSDFPHNTMNEQAIRSTTLFPMRMNDMALSVSRGCNSFAPGNLPSNSHYLEMSPDEHTRGSNSFAPENLPTNSHYLKLSPDEHTRGSNSFAPGNLQSNSHYLEMSPDEHTRGSNSFAPGSLPFNSLYSKMSSNEVLKKNNYLQKNIEQHMKSSVQKPSYAMSVKPPLVRKKFSGRIPKFLQCFLCVKFLNDTSFSEHLLFGPAQCTECNFYFGNCQAFQSRAVLDTVRDARCHHPNLKFQDPVKYITGKLCINSTEKSLESCKQLQTFIDSLDSLKDRSPWKEALSLCKEFLLLARTKDSNISEKEHINTNNDTFGIKKRNGFNIALLNSSMDIYEERVTHSVQEETVEDILTQDYDLGSLEKATEFVKVSENSCFTTSIKSQEVINKNPKPVKMRKKLQGTEYGETSAKPKYGDTFGKLKFGDTSGKRNYGDTSSKSECGKTNGKSKCAKASGVSEYGETGDLPDDSVAVDLLPLRSDGFYYISTKAIEECPNCYSVLCPSRFTVNVETFLMTVLCSDCNLTIYITSPEVRIVTKNEDDNYNTTSVSENVKKVQTPKIESKGKRPRGRPRKYPLGNDFLRR